MALALVASILSPTEAQYGRLHGDVEIRPSLSVHVGDPPGIDSLNFGLNSGFMVRNRFSMQFLLQFDLAPLFSADEPAFLKSRVFEVAPGLRWWILPQSRFCPFVDVYLSVPINRERQSNGSMQWGFRQGIRGGLGVLVDVVDGYGFSASVSAIHLFRSPSVTLLEFAPALLIVF